ncbi:L,D-transpeptidase family protein [Paracoccus sp. (in: a-proteobacteria)]|uniref:L,D-transpeptidase family protein n=1 Tax=Paracoccus sp. TaxID=267 RepID=UPI0026C53108
MPRRLALSTFFGLSLLAASAIPAAAQTSAATQDRDVPFTAEQMELAAYDGGDLPRGRSALTAKVQLLLDRSGTSPGVIDGYKGAMSESAIRAFERRVGLPEDGLMDPHVWNLLQSYSEIPLTQTYTITQEDAEGLVDDIPSDFAEKAKMSTQGYTSIAEKLGERFHMDEKFISFLNPGVPMVPGSTIKVANPAANMSKKVARIFIDKATRRVAAYDEAGRMIVDYPATIGSDATPSPSGKHRVTSVAINPNYTYNPSKNFKQGNNDKALIIPPGPNGPVGSVWIDLSKPTYGIHGTPTPSQLFRNQSRGCVRLTNWDAQELARLVIPGVTTVEFLDPGVTIADVTGAGAQPAATRDAMLETASAAAAEAVTQTNTVSDTLPAPATVTTKPAAPLSLPETGGGATPAPPKVYENTSEETADAAASLAPQRGDPLSHALSGALPDAFVVPPLEGEN